MRIVLDTLGGDNPPEEIIKGGLQAVEAYGVELVIAGEGRLIEREIRGHSSNLSIIEAPEAVTMEDSPTEAVRKKKDSSLMQGIAAVREGRAEAFVSPGNTGAVMAAALLRLGRLAGIERPGIAVPIPALDGKNFLLIDSGANADCSPLNLKQFAIMGKVYMEEILGVARPRIGLLNIGAEQGKGSELVRKAFAALEELEGFVGNVESNRILRGGVDVVVCDGFVGNILLKGIEGSSAALMALLKRAIRRNLRAKLGALLLAPTLRGLKEEIDAAHYGGAPLLGIKGVVIVAHGHSDALAIKNAIRVAKSAVESSLPEKIEQGIARLGGRPSWIQTLRYRKREP
ncbi:MAG: phosphate acyltransferase PlsX [Candidatus Bipolaricaulia bacterium]